MNPSNRAVSSFQADKVHPQGRVVAISVIGTSISAYKILEKIGEGAMGGVYLSEDSRLERKVALILLDIY